MLHFHKEIQTSNISRLKNKCSDGLKWELYPDSIIQQLSTLMCESRKLRKKDRERERKESARRDEENYCSRLQRVSRFTNSATQLSRLVPTFETSPRARKWLRHSRKSETLVASRCRHRRRRHRLEARNYLDHLKSSARKPKPRFQLIYVKDYYSHSSFEFSQSSKKHGEMNAKFRFAQNRSRICSRVTAEACRIIKRKGRESFLCIEIRGSVIAFRAERSAGETVKRSFMKPDLRFKSDIFKASKK